VNPAVTVTTRVADGDPVDVLAEQSRTSRLLVLGRSGRGRLFGALHSSPVAGVARTARCPVLVVPTVGPPRRPWWPRSR
jgi:nucleotide-binding universal stress UspA family protein